MNLGCATPTREVGCGTQIMPFYLFSTEVIFDNEYVGHENIDHWGKKTGRIAPAMYLKLKGDKKSVPSECDKVSFSW